MGIFPSSRANLDVLSQRDITECFFFSIFLVNNFDFCFGFNPHLCSTRQWFIGTVNYPTITPDVNLMPVIIGSGSLDSDNGLVRSMFFVVPYVVLVNVDSF